ncbi:hypothetical protein GH714_024289 [Hevea brasiliensis]|uniref:Uncharacterized protein n=1 Tax=Hevea brasiliensis TaxID=3981 RepID=A0A6A6L1U0_HEVBR|nr:hypothetical protein GH714_024289 [Hevea brasiliensis]
MLKWDEECDIHVHVEAMEGNVFEGKNHIVNEGANLQALDGEDDSVNTNLQNIDIRGFEASENSGSSTNVEYDVENNMDAINDDSDEAALKIT